MFNSLQLKSSNWYFRFGPEVSPHGTLVFLGIPYSYGFWHSHVFYILMHVSSALISLKLSTSTDDYPTALLLDSSHPEPTMSRSELIDILPNSAPSPPPFSTSVIDSAIPSVTQTQHLLSISPLNRLAVSWFRWFPPLVPLQCLYSSLPLLPASGPQHGLGHCGSLPTFPYSHLPLPPCPPEPTHTPETCS